MSSASTLLLNVNPDCLSRILAWLYEPVLISLYMCGDSTLTSLLSECTHYWRTTPLKSRRVQPRPLIPHVFSGLRHIHVQELDSAGWIEDLRSTSKLVTLNIDIFYSVLKVEMLQWWPCLRELKCDMIQFPQPITTVVGEPVDMRRVPATLERLSFRTRGNILSLNWLSHSNLQFLKVTFDDGWWMASRQLTQAEELLLPDLSSCSALCINTARSPCSTSPLTASAWRRMVPNLESFTWADAHGHYYHPNRIAHAFIDLRALPTSLRNLCLFCARQTYLPLMPTAESHPDLESVAMSFHTASAYFPRLPSTTDASSSSDSEDPYSDGFADDASFKSGKYPEAWSCGTLKSLHIFKQRGDNTGSLGPTNVDMDPFRRLRIPHDVAEHILLYERIHENGKPLVFADFDDRVDFLHLNQHLVTEERIILDGGEPLCATQELRSLVYNRGLTRRLYNAEERTALFMTLHPVTAVTFAPRLIYSQCRDGLVLFETKISTDSRDSSSGVMRFADGAFLSRSLCPKDDAYLYRHRRLKSGKKYQHTLISPRDRDAVAEQLCHRTSNSITTTQLSRELTLASAVTSDVYYNYWAELVHTTVLCQRSFKDHYRTQQLMINIARFIETTPFTSWIPVAEANLRAMLLITSLHLRGTPNDRQYFGGLSISGLCYSWTFDHYVKDNPNDLPSVRSETRKLLKEQLPAMVTLVTSHFPDYLIALLMHLLDTPHVDDSPFNLYLQGSWMHKLVCALAEAPESCVSIAETAFSKLPLPTQRDMLNTYRRRINDLYLYDE